MAIMKEIKQVFKDLIATELLNLKGRTQNANESFNSKVLSVCLKTLNIGFKTIKIAAEDALATFNEGNASSLGVLEKLDC